MEKLWDGKDATGRYQFSIAEVAAWNMTKDENGNIYYITHEAIPQQNLYCAASQLTAHLRSLIRYNLVIAIC
jgi:hypothetical protein